MNFTDDSSQEQIRIYKTHELLGARERNEQNLARWHNGLKQRWELEQLDSLNSRVTTEKVHGTCKEEGADQR